MCHHNYHVAMKENMHAFLEHRIMFIFCAIKTSKEYHTNYNYIHCAIQEAAFT